MDSGNLSMPVHCPFPLHCTLSLIDTPAKTRGPAAPVVLATYIKGQHRQQNAVNPLLQQCVSLITYPLSTLKQNVSKLSFFCLLSFSSWKFRRGLCLLKRHTVYRHHRLNCDFCVIGKIPIIIGTDPCKKTALMHPLISLSVLYLNWDSGVVFRIKFW